MSLRRRRDIWDVVVVGGGIAGLTAAWYCARRGLPTALLEAQGFLGGEVATVNKLDDWPSTVDVSGAELATTLSEKLGTHGVEVRHEAAVAIQPADGLLLVKTENRALRTRRVIAAAGARLRAFDVPGAETLRGKGVSQCAHCDGYFFKGEDVVVVGGGDSALQEALVLAPLCRSVTLVVRSRLRAKQVYVERAAGAPNVSWVWDSEIEAVLGNGTVSGVRLRNVKTDERREVKCSGVFPFIGVEPNTAFLPPSVRCDDGGRVITDERMRTSERLIFAIGALRSGYSGELTSAAGEAAIAANAAAADLAH